MPFLKVRFKGVGGWKHSGVLATSILAALRRVPKHITVMGSELFLCFVLLVALGTLDQECLLLGELTSRRMSVAMLMSLKLSVAAVN